MSISGTNSFSKSSKEIHLDLNRDDYGLVLFSSSMVLQKQIVVDLNFVQFLNLEFVHHTNVMLNDSWCNKVGEVHLVENLRVICGFEIAIDLVQTEGISKCFRCRVVLGYFGDKVIHIKPEIVGKQKFESVLRNA